VRYTDGTEALLGDFITIGTKNRGVVMANIDGNEYTDGYPSAQWSYLRRGILVDTDFGGLAHYEDSKREYMVLVKRA
jgi:hypothetical protein